MKSTPPSFLAILICLSGGLFVGRSVFPKLDAANLADASQEQLEKAYLQRPNQRQDMTVAARKLLDRLSGADFGACTALWTELVAQPNSSAKNAQMQVLISYAEQSAFPQWAEFFAKHRAEFAWWGLESPDAESPDATGPAVATARAKAQSIRQLEMSLEKAPGTARAEILAGLGRVKGALAPRDYQDWPATITDPVEQAAAATAFAAAWAEAEPTEASAWMVTLPDGALKTAAILGFVSVATPNEAVSALGWALLLREEATRGPLVRRLLRHTRAADVEAARAYLMAAAIPPEERTEHLSILQSAGHGIADEP